MPANGYFEWTGPKTDRQPHHFTRADGQPMALAGLWDRWRSADKSETKETFTIITTEPSKFAAQFHNRMPLVLDPDTWDLWMKGDPEAAATLMKPTNEDALVERQVSKAMNNVKNNASELLAEWSGGASGNKTASPSDLETREFDVTERHKETVVAKTARTAEEVVVRTEVVSDTVRETKVDVGRTKEQPKARSRH